MRMVRFRIILTLTLLAVSSLACKSNQSGATASQTANGNANAEAEMQTGGVSGGKASAARVFRGFVGENTVQLTLSRDSDRLTGSYFYQRIKSAISLKGSINGQGDFTLQEFDGSGKQTGEFKGKWIEPSSRPSVSLEGTWSKPNSKDTLSFFATEQIVEFNNGLNIATKEIKEDNKKQRYSIKVEYPELAGTSNVNAEKFNQEVRNLITNETRAFKEGETDADAEDSKSDTGTGSDIQIGYDVTLATNDLISVLFGVSNYSSGAAHPNSYSLVITFDLKAGRTLKLSDLFVANSDYLNAISRFATNDLKKQMGQDADSDWIEKGAAPDLENYSNWNISRKGLAITFDPYQVASYADGPKYVIVPFSSLKDVSRPDGPISYVSK